MQGEAHSCFVLQAGRSDKVFRKQLRWERRAQLLPRQPLTWHVKQQHQPNASAPKLHCARGHISKAVLWLGSHLFQSSSVVGVTFPKQCCCWGQICSKELWLGSGLLQSIAVVGVTSPKHCGWDHTSKAVLWLGAHLQNTVVGVTPPNQHCYWGQVCSKALWLGSGLLQISTVIEVTSPKQCCARGPT